MRLTWAQPEDLLAHELVQSAAEGRDVGRIAEAWEAAGGSVVPAVSGAGPAPATPELRALARDLLDELAALPTPPAPDEPDDWDDIVALWPAGVPGVRGAAGGEAGPGSKAGRGAAGPATEDLERRVLGAWTGRAAGCLLGKPVEKIPREGIEEILRATGRWPLDRWFTAVGLPDDVAARWPWNRRSAPTSLDENIAGMPEDDDLNYPILALALLEARGREFTTDAVVQLWLDNLPGGRVFTAERAAYRNILDARPVPETATYRNPFREWIGALIRTDVLGWVSPGDVREAARLAWTDARLSHTRNGVYGAMWAAALASAAMVARDVDEVLDLAETVLPPRSRIADAVRLGREAARDGDVTTGLDRLHAAYGHLHWVHVLNNAATIAYALAKGGGEFGPSVSIAVTAGWDTDSVGATVGGVLGALLGVEGIGAQWTGPLDGRIATSLPGGEQRIADLARRTVALAGPVDSARGHRGEVRPDGAALDGAALGGAVSGSAVSDSARPNGVGRGGRVVVVGSANVDLVVDVPRHPRGGETLLGGGLRRHPGGKGANQAVAAARAGGADTTFVGAVGGDDGADLLLASLDGAGVRTDLVGRTETPTGTALITISGDGENAIVVAPGANEHVCVDAAGAARIADADVVLAQLEVPLDVVVAAAEARRPGALFALNAAPSRDLPDAVWDAMDVLIVNEHEALDLATGDGLAPSGPGDLVGAGAAIDLADAEALAAVLLKRVPAVVVTLGGEGCLVAERGAAPVRVHGLRIDVVDTTGAGDTFCGVLCAELAAGADLVDAAGVASVAAALAVTRPGAQDAVPTVAEARAFAPATGSVHAVLGSGDRGETP